MSSKHAYLIMAHTDYPILIELIKALDDLRNDIYLHIDLKAVEAPLSSLKAVLKYSGLYLVDRMSVNWGGPSQIKCELFLMQSAIQGHYAYYHLLTGQTYPLKSQEYIHGFFDANQGKEFIGFDNSKDYSDRVRYVHLFPEIGKATTKLKQFQFGLRNKFIQLQKVFRYERPQTRGKNFKKGLVYWSLTEEAVQFLLDKKEEILSVYNESTCADELFAQTILYNSKFRDVIFSLDNQYESCSRLIKPVRSWGNHSDIIKSENSFTIKDIELLLNTDKMFGLKFCGESGLEVIEELKKSYTKRINKDKVG